MWELFLFGTFWFWALCAAELVLLFIFVENEKGWSATVSLLTFGALLQWCGQIDILGYAWAHPIHILGALASYFLIGFGWSTFKWFDFVVGRKHEYEEMKADFLRSKGQPSNTKVVPEELRKEWIQQLGYRHTQKWGEPPQIRDNKARWMHWASMWPISIICYLIGDLIVNIFNSVYRRIASWLQRRADDIWAKASIAEDMKVPEEPEPPAIDQRYRH